MEKQVTNMRALVGQQGEDAVVDYLNTYGYTCIAKNYRIKAGEIDIIAKKDTTLVFVEVKTRNKIYFDLSEVVTPAKQRKIVFTARHYIFRNNVQNMVYRFDIALVVPKKNESNEPAGPWGITYIKNAFTDTESFL